MSIEIKSAKLKDKMFLEYSFEETVDNGSNTVTKKSNLPIHEDLALAFKRVIPHFALLCEQRKDSPEIKKLMNAGVFHEDEITKDFEVTGFTIGGSGDNEGVTLIGKRFLSTGKVLNLNSPFTKWDDEEYKYINDLSEHIETLRTEVFEYYNGKHAPLPQKSMFDEPGFIPGDDEGEEDENAA